MSDRLIGGQPPAAPTSLSGRGGPNAIGELSSLARLWLQGIGDLAHQPDHIHFVGLQFGSPELALAAVSALRGGSACLLANHGMVALGSTLAGALRLAAEVETLAAQYWHAAQIGTPHVLPRDELLKVKARFGEYGQQRPRTRRSW